MLAPGRARRPGAGVARIDEETPEELEACPFCAGREDRTPPETLRIGDPWQVRVVPNLFPAFERQEVVVHTPRHVRALADLTDGELESVAEAWSARRRAEPHGYLHAFFNEGRAAGASLPHTHSQLVWLEREPAAVQDERPAGVAELLGRSDLVIAERDGTALVSHAAARTPYELLIAPRDPESMGIFSPRLPVGLKLLAEATRRLRAVEGHVPWNAWLHAGRHWHIEVVPRLTVLAGIELGAAVYVNTLAPEEAAEALRAATS